jgi:hypothetical protein
VLRETLTARHDARFFLSNSKEGESGVEHGLQFFNPFNHPNFGLPGNNLADGTYGQITYLEHSPTSNLGSTTQTDISRRMIQLKLQLRF